MNLSWAYSVYLAGKPGSNPPMIGCIMDHLEGYCQVYQLNIRCTLFITLGVINIFIFGTCKPPQNMEICICMLDFNADHQDKARDQGINIYQKQGFSSWPLPLRIVLSFLHLYIFIFIHRSTYIVASYTCMYTSTITKQDIQQLPSVLLCQN